MRPLTAAVVLAAVVVVVGAVGYFVVSAMSHTETKSSTEHGCTPSAACSGTQQAVVASPLAGAVAAPSRG
ncbi:MAG TPA: hypothetical protein VEH28_01125 [Thermoplasmata archaeon]|nr:hypothetical protein [Thermoplasmata archaeon]